MTEPEEVLYSFVESSIAESFQNYQVSHLDLPEDQTLNWYEIDQQHRQQYLAWINSWIDDQLDTWEEAFQDIFQRVDQKLGPATTPKNSPKSQTT